MIVADRPRRYSRRGKRWSHLCSPDPVELEAFARAHGLKRRDRHPFLHYDVTEGELEALGAGVTVVEARDLFNIMRGNELWPGEA